MGNISFDCWGWAKNKLIMNDGLWGFRILIISVGFGVWLISGMPKTWFGLSKEEKKKRKPLLISGIMLITLGLAAFFMFLPG